MITLFDKKDIAVAYEKTTKHEGAYATCRLIDHEAPDCQEWAEHCEVDGVPAKVFYIFENEDCTVEDASDMPWHAEHVSKIELAEKDEDEVLAYYSGNHVLDCSPTVGSWVGDTFTAEDGSRWTVDPSDSFPHPCEDGTGVHYLLPA